MRSPLLTRIVVTFLVGAQLNLAASPAAAGTFTTGDYLGYQTPAADAGGQRAERLARVRDFLAEQRVQSQFRLLGVDPAIAETRIAALSDAELAQLDTQLANLPAGGGIVVIVGVVFIVLLVLELVGVTDVFTAI